ncbi:hypothetical protein BC938DRAFT_472406 [Jimgerdemannia flammicorona]|uniref:Uncharacterized protein n=1 Tax=Jimgerdemannia flammicorona TaxID=994334 RepID=A0A433Q659_9FUNG|nr:hypothetical protein BC938DRAFT_472406 [Jimgerdemannia flammicorona]
MKYYSCTTKVKNTQAKGAARNDRGNFMEESGAALLPGFSRYLHKLPPHPWQKAGDTSGRKCGVVLFKISFFERERERILLGFLGPSFSLPSDGSHGCDAGHVRTGIATAVAHQHIVAVGRYRIV